MGSLRLFFWAITLIFSWVATAQNLYHYVRIPVKFADRELFEKHGFIRDHGSHPDFLFGYLPRTENTLATNARYHLRMLDEAAMRHQAFNPVTLEPLENQLLPGADAEDYHTYETLTAELQTLAKTYPNLVKLESAGKTVQGRELWLMRLSNYATSFESRPKLLYISSMHGDEVTGKEMMVYLLRDLLAGYGKVRRVTALIDNAELFIMPSMNPDGTALKQRWNAHSVDLNRNFPRLEEAEFSPTGREPETLALMELFKKHHFLVSMNFHGGDLCVNIPWDSSPNVKAEKLFGDDALMMSLAKTYAATNGPMYDHHEGSFVHGVTYGYEWFQILGGMQDWSSFFRQTTHATLEISTIKWPSAAQLPQFWKENHESLLNYLDGAMVGVHLKVVDEAGKGLPVAVRIDSATRSLSYPNGYVHRPTINKRQTVTLSAAGFEPTQLTIDPAAFNGSFETVVLKKAAE